MEPFVILALAAALSAIVVWWATIPPEERTRAAKPGKVSTAPRPTPPPPEEEPVTDSFVLAPGDSPLPPDERPPRVLSLLRLALTITFFAAVGVGILAVLGYLVKTQLDQYFTGL